MHLTNSDPPPYRTYPDDEDNDDDGQDNNGLAKPARDQIINRGFQIPHDCLLFWFSPVIYRLGLPLPTDEPWKTEM
jgi:hypothetical protein